MQRLIDLAKIFSYNHVNYKLALKSHYNFVTKKLFIFDLKGNRLAQCPTSLFDEYDGNMDQFLESSTWAKADYLLT